MIAWGPHPGRLARDGGQATSEYVLILGMITAATIGMLATLLPLTRLVAGLVRRIVIDLSG